MTTVPRATSEATPTVTDDLRWPLVLDGGLSNVLEEQGCDLDQKLWSAAMLATDPEAIVRAHLGYLRAGADIITTASYQASIPGFVAAGMGETEARAMLRRSVELAQRARAAYREESPSERRPILVAASVGPYGAFLADGSEYTGVYDAGDDQLRDFHRPRLHCLATSGAELLAVETQPCLREIAILAELLASAAVPAWVSFCCRDGAHLHDGSSLADAIALFRDSPRVFALGANCTAPEHIADIVRLVRREAPGKRIVVYPNSGEVYEPASGTWHGTSEPAEFRQLAAEWLRLGADIVGGCCRIGPAQIRELRALLDPSD